MRRKNIVLTISLVLFSIFFLGLVSYYEKPVLAQSSCPKNIDPNSLECLDYLREQLGILQSQQGRFQKQIAQEEYQQLSLQEKISYLDIQVEQTKSTIKSLEVAIASHDIEIKFLEKNIKEKEDNISVLGQEINTLEDSVVKRVSKSYKYSFVGPLEIFLDVKNLSSILRKTKYLAATRNQDKQYLEEFNLKTTEIKIEENYLNKEKEKLEKARNSIDEERIELANIQKSLVSQKAERERLLAESRAKKAELQAAYQTNIQKVAALDRAIIEYINAHPEDVVNKGWVTTGMAIGRMGNTGTSSTGSHLHLGLNSGKSYSGWGHFWSDVNLFSSGFLKKKGTMYWPGYGWDAPILFSGSARIPFNANYIFTHQDEHQGNAIDMAPYRSLSWGSKIEGAPVYPIMEGELYKGYDGRGGNYAKVHHTNGMVSVYLHLQ